MAEAVLELIASRRVVRVMTDEPVAREDLERILDAGRWAPTGGNTRSVRFVAVEDPTTLRLLRMVSRLSGIPLKKDSGQARMTMRDDISI